MSTSKMDNVQSIDKTKFVWGTKLMGNNYKSVTIHGELFALGDCVRCPLKLRDGHVGKIIKLFQKEDRMMCKIRSFFSSSEFPPHVKGLNCILNPKELFLASGEGLGVENDMLLDNITSRCIVLCTAKEHFNEMPSNKQIEAADYFFCRGYDPINEEIVGLDTVEETIGAQKIYNKKDWLVDKIIEQSSSQGAIIGTHSSTYEVPLISPRDSMERKLKRKSCNLVPKSHKIDHVIEKNNESHILKKFKIEVGATPIEKSDAHYEHLVFALLAPSKIKSNQRLEVLPIKNALPISSISKAKVIQQDKKGGPFKVSSSSLFLDYSKQDTTKDEGTNIIENIEKKNEDMLGEGIPNKNMKPVQSSDPLVEKREPPKLQKKTTKGAIISTIKSSKTISSLPILQTRKVLPTKNVLKAKTLNSSVMKMDLSIPYTSLGTSKEVLQTNDINMILNRNEDFLHATSTNQCQFGSQIRDLSNKKGNISIAKDLCCYESNFLESPRTTSSKDMTNIGQLVNLLESSPSTRVGQKPQGQIFKPKVEDWNISLVPAIQSNRVLLLKNLIPGLHSDELAEIFTNIMKIRCEVRIVPPISSNYQTTMALLKFPSAKKAQDVIHEMESKYVLVANRLVTATLFNHLEFKASHLSKYYGHLEFPKEGRDHINDDYRNVVATSHLAQGNTIEFAFGLPWRVLDEQHDEQWKMLQETHYSNSNKKIKVN